MALNLRKTIAIMAVFSIVGEILAGPMLKSNEKDFTLRIVHTNDMHARFEETSQRSTTCSPKDKAAGKCYGGFGRIATLVRQTRRSNVTSLFLNAGDTFQGTVWYNIYKWEAVVKFMNLLAPDAVSLGNHEFDDGVAGLVPFIQNANFPVLCSNLDLSKEPSMKASKLLKSTVLTKDGRKIGVIGYLTPETKILSNTGNVIFEDEIDSIRKEVKKLKEQGVNILIALGHSGFEVDKKIAKEVEDIDLVIGGHSNTFLYNGLQPDIEALEGFYPTEVQQKSGRKVYVVQAYAYTKYLGNVTIDFDSHGEIKKIVGNPALVDGSIEQAQDVLDLIEKMKPAIDNVTRLEVGRTRVLLDGDSKSCRLQECNLGNLITDAMIDYNAAQYFSKNGWTDASIAVQNSGSIRSSITRDNDDKVTMGDVMGSLPFGNTVVKVSMTGAQILSMLEISVRKVKTQQDTSNLHGAFLQFSGMQVTYDLKKPAYSKVDSVLVQCSACRVPSYSELQKNATYNVLMNDFIYLGGDGYEMLKNLTATPLGVASTDVVVEYLQKRSPVHPGVEWRISYKKETAKAEPSAANTYHPIAAIILLPIITLKLTL